VTTDQLLELLGRHEWRDIECKAARSDCPKDAWSTASAFANTEGGHLLLGVKKNGSEFELVDMQNVDATQSAVVTTFRNLQKFSSALEFAEELHRLGDGTVLTFYIHEAPRSQKPIYVIEDRARVAYIRKGGEDCKANEVEIARWIRDASAIKYDALPVSISHETFFDEDLLRWYRRVLDNQEEGRYADKSDVEFLDEMGMICEDRQRLAPTRAAVLLFGKPRYVRQLLPRPVVDYFRFRGTLEDVEVDRRWADRLTIEGNLIHAWRSLVDRYYAQAERPFVGVDPTTLRRIDDPPDFVAFREATINLLAHQDYGDHGRLATIKFYRDRWVFHNPGDALDSVERLLEPGAKELRNPSIMTAFRRIGLSDQAGTGVRSIYTNWRSLRYFPPEIENDKVTKSFQLSLLREHLPSERVRLVQERLGVALTDLEADLFAYACENDGRISLVQAKTVGLKSAREIRAVLQHMVSEGLLVTEGDYAWLAPEGHRAVFGLPSAIAQGGLTSTQTGDSTTQATTLPPSDPNLGTAQIDLGTAQARPLSDRDIQVLEVLAAPLGITDAMSAVGISHRRNFTRRYIQPLVAAGLIRPEHGEPNHPQQRYLLTDSGRRALEVRKKGDGQ